MRYYVATFALLAMLTVSVGWLASNRPEHWWQQSETGPQPEPLPGVIIVPVSEYEDRPDELVAELSRLVSLGYHLTNSTGIGGRWFVMWLPQGCVMELAKK